MSVDIERIKKIDDETRKIVFGYIRNTQYQLCLNNNNPFYIISELITYTCMLFYYTPQVFVNPPDCLKLSGIDNNTITKIKDGTSWLNSIYTGKWIESNTNKIHKWNVKVHVNPYAYGIAIGIVNNKHVMDINNPFNTENGYLYNNYNTLVKDGESINNKGIPYSTNDEMLFILDLNRAMILCSKNKGKEKMLFSNIPKSDDIKYKLALSMYCHKDSITVTDIY
eukprot:524752_1